MSESPKGSAGVLALLAFSAVAIMIGLVFNGMFPLGTIAICEDVALVFGVLLVICAVLEFCAGNTLGVTTIGMFASMWLCYVLSALWFSKMIPATALMPATVLFCIGFIPTFLVFFFAVLKTNWIFIIIYFLILMYLILLAVAYGVTGMLGLIGICGWLLIIVGLLGTYFGAAVLLSITWGKAVLPVFTVKQ